MKSPVSMAPCSSGLPKARGYTVVELVVATSLTLLMMAGVVTLFAAVTNSVTEGQAMMEVTDRLRATEHRLQLDLKYATARMVPPLDPRDGLGYTEIIEGPGPSWEIQPYPPAANSQVVRRFGIQPANIEATGVLDSSVGDVDDVLMLTARSYGEPFVGRHLYKDFPQAGETPDGSDNVGPFVWRRSAQSQVAEIAWFLRGNTLYRRVLLVTDQDRDVRTPGHNGLPNMATFGNPFYEFFDVSVHQEGGNPDPRANWGNQMLVPNSLGDLTKREHRYGHQPFNWPHTSSAWRALGLPTLRESSHRNWPFPYTPGVAPGSPVIPNGVPLPFPPPYGDPETGNNAVDYWRRPHHGWPNELELETGTLLPYFVNAPRVAEDVILTNVISFDVKVWDPFAPVLRLGNQGVVIPGDPGYRDALRDWIGNNRPDGQVASRGAYVDLYYARGIVKPNFDPQGNPVNPISLFSHAGFPKSGLSAFDPNNSGDLTLPAVYDTYSTHYERDGIDQHGDNLIDLASDGVDNNNTGGVDDPTEAETSPPYPAPLRSIQIKIRVFERDSQRVREVTVTQDFLR